MNASQGSNPHADESQISLLTATISLLTCKKGGRIEDACVKATTSVALVGKYLYHCADPNQAAANSVQNEKTERMGFYKEAGNIVGSWIACSTD